MSSTAVIMVLTNVLSRFVHSVVPTLFGEITTRVAMSKSVAAAGRATCGAVSPIEGTSRRVGSKTSAVAGASAVSSSTIEHANLVVVTIVVQQTAVVTHSRVAHAGFARVEAEALIRDTTDGEDMIEAEDDLGENVENAVEDHLAKRGDDVATVGHTPCDRVEEPDAHEEDS